MVFTKAIVKKTCTTESNYYDVYIPLLRKANDAEEDATLQATRIEISGIKDDLKVGDVVYVSFEDDKYGKPIIIGKLYTGKEEEVSSNQSLRTLAVSDKAQLPGDTTIGDTSLDELKNIINEELVHKQEALTNTSVKAGTLSSVIGFDANGVVKRTNLSNISTTYVHNVEVINVKWERVGSSWVKDEISLGFVRFESTSSASLTFQDLCSTASALSRPLSLYYDDGNSTLGYSIYPSYEGTITTEEEQTTGDTLGEIEDPFAHVAFPGLPSGNESSLIPSIATYIVEESVSLVYLINGTVSRNTIYHDYEGFIPGPKTSHFETKDTVVELVGSIIIIS